MVTHGPEKSRRTPENSQRVWREPSPVPLPRIILAERWGWRSA